MAGVSVTFIVYLLNKTLIKVCQLGPNCTFTSVLKILKSDLRSDSASMCMSRERSSQGPSVPEECPPRVEETVYDTQGCHGRAGLPDADPKMANMDSTKARDTSGHLLLSRTCQAESKEPDTDQHDCAGSQLLDPLQTVVVHFSINSTRERPFVEVR